MSEAALYHRRGLQTGLPPMNRPAPAPLDDTSGVDTAAQAPLPRRELSPAAKRALAEAAIRRAEIDAKAAELASQAEKAGRGGLEPVRYGDWEIKGLTTDF